MPSIGEHRTIINQGEGISNQEAAEVEDTKMEKENINQDAVKIDATNQDVKQQAEASNQDTIEIDSTNQAQAESAYQEAAPAESTNHKAVDSDLTNEETVQADSANQDASKVGSNNESPDHGTVTEEPFVDTDDDDEGCIHLYF